VGRGTPLPTPHPPRRLWRLVRTPQQKLLVTGLCNMQNATDEWLVVCCAVYTALALAMDVSDWLLQLVATTNKRRLSLTHDIWKFQTKWQSKRSHWHQPPGISTYIGLLLMIYRPVAWVISTLLKATFRGWYVDRLIIFFIVWSTCISPEILLVVGLI